MKKTILIFFVIGFFVAATGIATENSEEYGKEKGKLKKGYTIIKKTGSEQGPVTFFHRKHKGHAINDQKCKTCHHVGKWKQSCGEVGCHRDPALDSEGARIHAGCLERCHEKNEGKAPTDCADCHR